MSKRTAVIGLGNLLRRDDGIGIVLIQSLFQSYRQEGVDYLDFGTASFDLVHRIQEYDVVLVIDGINAAGLEAGELIIRQLSAIEYSADSFATSSHELDLRTLFQLHKTLELKTKIYVAGIQVKDVSFGEGLTEVLQERFEKIVSETAVFIKQRFCSKE